MGAFTCRSPLIFMNNDIYIYIYDIFEVGFRGNSCKAVKGAVHNR